MTYPHDMRGQEMMAGAVIPPPADAPPPPPPPSSGARPAASTDALERAARQVCALFGESGWPRIEVINGTHDRPTMPLSDDDADKVRALRKALADRGHDPMTGDLAFREAGR